MKAEIAAERMWGPDGGVKVIQPGVFLAETSCHGGFLIDQKVAKTYLSPTARSQGVKIGQFLAFEEDCNATIVFFEHPELLGRKVTKKLKAQLWEDVRELYPTSVQHKISGPQLVKTA